jgi:hypothetical protein
MAEQFISYRVEGEVAKVWGRTFPIKEELKEAGGRFDSESKVWEVPAAKIPELAGLAMTAYGIRINRVGEDGKASKPAASKRGKAVEIRPVVAEEAEAGEAGIPVQQAVAGVEAEAFSRSAMLAVTGIDQSIVSRLFEALAGWLEIDADYKALLVKAMLADKEASPKRKK